MTGHFPDKTREDFRSHVARLVAKAPSIGAVEQRAGISEGALYKFLRAERWISDDSIEKLADYFKVPFIEMWRRSRGKPLSPEVTPDEVAEVLDADPTMKEMFKSARELTPEAREEVLRLIRFRLAELMEQERKEGVRERPDRGTR